MIIGSIPVIIAGYTLSTTGLTNLLDDNLRIIAWTTLIFAIFLIEKITFPSPEKNYQFDITNEIKKL